MAQKIQHLAQILSGFHARKSVEQQRYGTHRLLQIRDFDADRSSVDFGALTPIDAGETKPEQWLRAGDVLFLAKGAKRFAHALEFDPPEPTLASGYFFVLRPSDAILPAYLAWFLNQSPAERHFQRFGTSGAHMPVVSRDVLGDLAVPVPNLSAQRAIIEMDDLARRQQTLLAALAEKKRTLATAACLRLADQSIALSESPQP